MAAKLRRRAAAGSSLLGWHVGQLCLRKDGYGTHGYDIKFLVFNIIHRKQNQMPSLTNM